MLNKISTIIISALGIVFLFSAMAFGKTDTIDVLYPATVGKSLKLKPGNYKIDVASNQKSPTVNFYNKEGKLIGQAPVKLLNETRKNQQTQVDYTTLASNNHVITEISPGGWKENLYFSHSKIDNASSMR
jgi:hypothetical protein